MGCTRDLSKGDIYRELLKLLQRVAFKELRVFFLSSIKVEDVMLRLLSFCNFFLTISDKYLTASILLTFKFEVFIESIPFGDLKAISYKDF